MRWFHFSLASHPWHGGPWLIVRLWRFKFSFERIDNGGDVVAARRKRIAEQSVAAYNTIVERLNKEPFLIPTTNQGQCGCSQGVCEGKDRSQCRLILHQQAGRNVGLTDEEVL